MLLKLPWAATVEKLKYKPYSTITANKNVK